ncbi:MAG: right-handed parallel beta-helix repeat-containing protein [Deltaproteobacteria bacterium]|nr:right-handed parallel beta-helix repeat-containing protein [Deltaproteobacteria bacterium]
MHKKRFFLVFIASHLLLFKGAIAEVFEVGEGKRYLNISDVPLESIKAGDTVLIYYRKYPYKEKWVITAVGTREKPVVFRGIPDENGNLPVIDGRDAITRKGLNFWSETRGIIKIGGSNNPPDTTPAYVLIENLEIVNAHTPYTFLGRNGLEAYESNSAAIFIEKGENITIRNCIIHHNGNGIFVASQARNVLIESNYIYGNGNVGSYYEHNTYTEADRIIYQFNRFGPLLDGALGNNLKDRSAGTIIRYNLIESGNRQLDLVDSGSEELRAKDYYRKTYVYGNLLIEPDGAGNSQILHYGGDSGITSNYRKGILYFYNNTVISTREGNTTLMRLSSSEEEAYVINNIVFATAGGNRVAILDSEGKVHLISNWINTGYKNSHSNPKAVVLDEGGNINSYEPGFANFESGDFHLLEDSVCIDKGIDLGTYFLLTPEYEFTEDRKGRIRFIDAVLDLGAFEFVKEIPDVGFDIPVSDLSDVEVNNTTDSDYEDPAEQYEEFASDELSDIGYSEIRDAQIDSDDLFDVLMEGDINKININPSEYKDENSRGLDCSCNSLE